MKKKKEEISKELFNYIVKNVDEGCQVTHVEEVVYQIKSLGEPAINAIVQVILKLIKHHREIPNPKIKDFKQFFALLFHSISH